MVGVLSGALLVQTPRRCQTGRVAEISDGEAFDALTSPYRRELHVHCYRMLGSYQDAEDALQDTLLAAWQSFGSFEGRASLRTWLYRIATNRCLNALRSARRRPAVAWNVPGVTLPEPSRLGEVVWLQPYPDAALDYERTESLSLAFVTALQLLPPRQVAVLVLRDVLDFPALEVASMLDTTVSSVESALKRARARLPATPVVPSPADEALAARFVAAYESADLEALVDLLTDDVFISMPPMPYEYVGREAARTFCANLFTTRRYRLLPTRANGQPAFGTYVHGQATGLIVLTVRGDHIAAMTRFDETVIPFFALPQTLI
ncbi:RNA polymerase subunit sigma-70 [Tenggerimyces flavus]|nr:RNA polymerase subunit sigma-70 [Tenggerimyces flavus]